MAIPMLTPTVTRLYVTLLVMSQHFRSTEAMKTMYSNSWQNMCTYNTYTRDESLEILLLKQQK